MKGQIATLVVVMGLALAARYLLPASELHWLLASANILNWGFFALNIAFLVGLAGFGVWALFWVVRLRRWRRRQELRKAQD